MLGRGRGTVQALCCFKIMNVSKVDETAVRDAVCCLLFNARILKLYGGDLLIIGS